MRRFQGGLCAAIAATAMLMAGAGRAQHVTDGIFTSPAEWSGPNVVAQPFSAVQAGANQNGGSTLYVERVLGATPGGVLHLMYDFTNSPTMGLNPVNSFFDVFFEIPNDNLDYVVRIHNGADNFQAVQKSGNTTSSQAADGSFNLSDPVWTPMSAGDLAIAQFHSALGFGTSPSVPGGATPHLMAEFQLTVEKAGFGGFYSPEPAFWSASVAGDHGSNGGAGGPGNPAAALEDPPISSALFTLDPSANSALLIVVPVLGPDGSPMQQPPNVPEPASALLAGLALLGGLGVRRRRNRVA